MCFKSKGASCHGDSGGGMFIREKNRLDYALNQGASNIKELCL